MENSQKPYEQECFSSKPTKFTKFLRRFFIWQIIRFIVINIKIAAMLLKSHAGHSRKY